MSSIPKRRALAVRGAVKYGSVDELTGMWRILDTMADGQWWTQRALYRALPDMNPRSIGAHLAAKLRKKGWTESRMHPSFAAAALEGGRLPQVRVVYRITDEGLAAIGARKRLAEAAKALCE